MPRACLTVLTALLLCLGAMAAWGGAAGIAVPRAINPPTLDGRLDDWPTVPLVTMGDAAAWHPAAPEFAEYGGQDDISAEVRLAWDNHDLYVAVETRDDALLRVKSPSEIDRGDSVVLALAAQGSEDLNQFVVALLKGTSLVWRSDPTASAGEVKLIERAIWARADPGGGWHVTYELGVPWSELAGLKPLAGSVFTLTVSSCDDDGAGLKGCLERATLVELSSQPPPVSPAPAPGPVTRPSLAPTSLAPEAVRYDQRRFFIRGQETLLCGGEVDYTRLPKEAWARRLQSLKAAGLNTVGVTVPWAYHQATPGPVDLSALRDFLGAVSASGLWAQVAVGPFAGETWEAGAVPGWCLELEAAACQEAAEEWLKAVLAVVKEYQVTANGRVVTVVVRPLPDSAGTTGPTALTQCANLARAAGIVVPTLTANAPAARDNSRQALANLLDTVSFYTPPAPAEVAAVVRELAAAENGPAIVSGLPGDYSTPSAARQSAEAIRVGLAQGAGAVIFPGFIPDAPRDGGAEMRLLGSFLQQFGSELARALPAEEVLQADDPNVRTAVRVGDRASFIFLWSEKGRGPHRVRLTYEEPGATGVTSLPAAGAITLPAGGARILPLDIPVGQGILRYSTSEVAGLHTIGDRTVLVVYGDPDTPGEIALRWPGPPLVVGEVLRQEWNADSSTLILDYYHKQQDQYLLVDDLQIALLARDRAAVATRIGEASSVILSAGTRVSDGTASSEGVKAVLHAPAGTTQVTAAVPGRPAAVLVDGKPVQFTYTAPARVLEFTLTTESFEAEQQPSSMLGRIGRSVIGGPPGLVTRFDRAQFLADADAPGTTWTPVGELGGAPEALGLKAGDIVRLRTRVDPAGRARLRLTGASDPLLVLVNGNPVSFGTTGPEREANVAALLRPGENEVSALVQVLPREAGIAGLRSPGKRLPVLSFQGETGELRLGQWEAARGLAGEAAGWTGTTVPAELGSLLRLGLWREQGKRYQEVTGAGWYRIPFALAKPDGWEIPYELRLAITGNAQVYVNGVKLATRLGTGSHVITLPTSLLAAGGDNLLAVALYDPAGNPGLDKVEIVAVPEGMTRRRELEIRF